MDDLASVWCAWAEMELNHEEFDKALEAVQRAVAEPAAAVQRRRLQASQSRDEKRRAMAEVGQVVVDSDISCFSETTCFVWFLWRCLLGYCCFFR